MRIIGLLAMASGCGYLAGYDRGWLSGRLHGRAEILRERSRR